MNRIEMIWHSLLIFGATLTVISYFFITLGEIVKKCKVGVRLFGIITLLLVVLLLCLILIPIPPSSIVSSAVIMFALGLFLLIHRTVVFIGIMRDLQKSTININKI